MFAVGLERARIITRVKGKKNYIKARVVTFMFNPTRDLNYRN